MNGASGEPHRMRGDWPLLWSAPDQPLLCAQAARLAEFLEAHRSLPLHDVAWTLAQSDSHQVRRAGLLASHHDQAIAALRAFSRGESDAQVIEGVARPRRGVVFAFPGVGGYWPGMARALYAESPVFAHTLDDCDRALFPHTQWSLRQLLLGEDAEQERAFARVDFVQPILFAMAVALAQTWQSFGVIPTAVIGHSLGELAAAYVAGALSLEDAALVVARRSQVTQGLAGSGAVATVTLPLLALEQRLAEYAGRVTVAAYHGPCSNLISGETAAVRALLLKLHHEGVFCRELVVGYASHSAAVEPVLPAVRRALAGLRPHKQTSIPYLSGIEGRTVEGRELGIEYWVRNERLPVRLDLVMAELTRTGPQLLLEVSTHPQLLMPIQQLQGAGGAVVASLRRGEGGLDRLLRSAIELHVHGWDVPWEKMLGPFGSRIALPGYEPVQVVSRQEDGDVCALVSREVARVLKLPAGAVLPLNQPLHELGLDSLMAVELRNRLAARTALALPVTLAFDYPTIEQIAELLRGSGEPSAQRAESAAASPSPSEPIAIAIVAMACRAPGEIASPEQLWQLVLEEKETRSELPRDRGWDVDDLYDPDPDALGKTVTRHGGFLKGLDRFDAALFGISSREAQSLDPQQRLLLEVSWEVLERAGIAPLSLGGSRTGVFIGAAGSDYGSRLAPPLAALDGYVVTGSTLSTASGRIAYTLGLQGPTMTVDTACSASLVSLHLACQALRSGECALALAGGVTVMSTPTMFVEFSRLRALAPDGRCKAFADAADGTSWSEGCGILLLERLGDARKNGHPILALIAGSAVNQDGRSQGLTAPSGPAQKRLIVDALRAAGVSADEVDAVEAHGTGTALGDPVEAQALLATYGQAHSASRPLWLGSIKSNLGHTQAAAGVTGVIKMVLALQHELLPRTLHAAIPSRHVDWSAGHIQLLQQARPWPRGEATRRAAVSSFGVSGTNAHLILQEAPPPLGTAEVGSSLGVVPLLLSGHDEVALRASADRLADYLDQNPEANGAALVYTLATARSPLSCRAALCIAAENPTDQLAASLRAVAQPGKPAGLLGPLSQKAGPLVVMFPGQGSQYAGMGQALYDSLPVFRQSLDALCSELDPWLPRPLKEVLFAASGTGAAELLDETLYTQPALFAIEVALYRHWQHLGLKVAAVLGHSVGELAAAHVAGALSAADACKLVAARARLMQTAERGGAMYSVRAPAAMVAQLLRGSEHKLSIAAINAPQQTVFSGDAAAAEQVARELTAQGKKVKRLRSAQAFHSPHMEPILRAFGEVAQALDYKEPALRLISCVTGQRVRQAELQASTYWQHQLRGQVHYAEAVRTAQASGGRIFLECGPQAVLLGMAAETLEGEPGIVYVASLNRSQNEMGGLMEAVGKLYVSGVDLAFPTALAGTQALLALPTYPFQRQRYWREGPGGLAVERLGLARSGHPLLGSVTALATGAYLFTSRLDRSALSYLRDHVVFEQALLPGTAFVELALAAGRHIGAAEVERLTIERPVLLPPRGALHLQLTVEAAQDDGARAFALYGRDDQAEAPWERHASGVLRPAPPAAPTQDIDFSWPPQEAEPIQTADLYERLAHHGYHYGPSFRALKQAFQKDAAVYGRVELAEALSTEEYQLHPALLDAALHTLLAQSYPGSEKTPQSVLPFEWEGVRVYTAGARQVWVQLTQVRDAAGRGDAHVKLYGAAGKLVAEIDRLRVRAASATGARDTVAGGALPLYQLQWPECPLPSACAPSGAYVVIGEGPESEAVVQALADGGAQVCRHSTVRSMQSAGAAGAHPPRHVVCVIGAATDEDQASAAQRLTQALLQELQDLIRADAYTDCGFVLVTHSAVAARAGEALAGLSQSALWGLCRSARSEQPDRRWMLLDTDGSPASQSLLGAVLGAQDEPEVALRSGVRLVPRLAVASGESQTVSANPAFDPNGTVLVTGGTAGLGALWACHLARAHNVKHLLLLSRSGATAPGAADLVAALLALGCRATVAACDVADAQALAQTVAALPAAHPLSAVFHLAAVLDDGVLAALTAERIERAFAAKARGAWNLHQQTRDKQLCAFVIFSSVAGWLGGAGQASYAAANTFVDALCAYRQANGLAGQALALGPWAQVGLWAQLPERLQKRLRQQGLTPLESGPGLALVDRALSRRDALLLPLQIELRALAAAETLPPILRSLTSPTHKRSSPGHGAPPSDLLARLRELSSDDQTRHIQQLISREVAAVLQLPDPAALRPEQPLTELGLDSLLAVETRNRLGTLLGLRLPATLLFDYPTVRDLSLHLLRARLGLPERAPETAVPAPTPRTGESAEPIAIVAMACRTPGGVCSPAQLWELLTAGHDAISPFPTDRGWDLGSLYDPDPAVLGKSYTKEGGFLQGADGFDASFFGISPREALHLDLQQRLLLEVSWEALENAGIAPLSLGGSRTGVFIGAMSGDYDAQLGRSLEELDGYVGTGSALSTASGRVAYFLGLQGAAMTVDTACSSALVSLHLAGQALRQGECDLVLAGGVTVMSTPALFVEFSRLRGLSADGRCKAFADAADGVGWSEGCGVLLLERLADARRAGHPVLALIRGGAVNQDGRSQGMTAPNGPAQQRVIGAALRAAGVPPESIDAVEAHGTGTKLGDPIEAQALLATYGLVHTAERPLWLGSLKSNLGHTQAAAGALGVIKMVLALQHGLLPKTLYADNPSSHIDWQAGQVQLLRQAQTWERREHPRRAAVSSFGVSGTNAHLILEEAPPPPEYGEEKGLAPEGWPLLLSGHSQEALRAAAGQLAAHLQRTPEISLPAVASTLCSHRAQFPHRAVVVAESPAQAAVSLRALAQGQPDAHSHVGQAAADSGVVFLFPGQGSQWPGMARALWARIPVFAAALTDVATALAPHTDWSLLDVLLASEAQQQESFSRVDIVQPVLFAMAVALARVWQWLGVQPAAVVGHSQGEIAAACIAGVLSLQEAAQVVAVRSRLLREHRCTGAMASIALPLSLVEKRLQDYGPRLSVAAVNGPGATAVAGDSQALAELLVQLRGEGIYCRELAIDYAAHSAQVDSVLPPLVRALKTLRPQPAVVPMFSTIDGKAVGGAELGAAYWADNLRQPVRLDLAVEALKPLGQRVYLEISAHPQLVTAVAELIAGVGVGIASLRRQEGQLAHLLHAAAQLWVRNRYVDWSKVIGEQGLTELPNYPFQRQRYWPDGPALARTRPSAALAESASGHPLLGPARSLSTQAALQLWEATWGQRLAWLRDHQIQGAVLFPAAGMVEMALAMGEQALGGSAYAVTDLVLSAALLLGVDGEVTVQGVATPERPSTVSIQLASRQAEDSAKRWTVHARAQVHRLDGPALPAPLDLAALTKRLGSPRSSASVYAALRTMGLAYGPAFQGLVKLWSGSGEALGQVMLPSAAGDAAGYHFHPALLDGCLQVLAGALAESESTPWVPVAVGALRWYRRPGSTVYCQARWTANEQAARRTADLVITDESGAVVTEVTGFTVQRLAAPTPRRPEDDWFLQLDWEVAAVGAPRLRTGRWLLFGDCALAAALSTDLQAAGHEVAHVATSSPVAELRAQLGQAFHGAAPTGVVHLRSLEDGEAADPSEPTFLRGCDSVLLLVQALAGMGWRDAPRLWLLTRGAQAVGGGAVVVAQAPLLGLGRTLAMEHAELRCTRVDLDPAAPKEELTALVSALLSDDQEEEVALRGTTRWAARLARPLLDTEAAEGEEPAAGRPFRLTIDQRGVLDRLALRAAVRRPPGPGEVELAVEAAGLNFLDVLLALGVLPDDTGQPAEGGLALGGECAGQIVAVGAGVSGLAVGDAVLALTAGAMASHVTTAAVRVVRRPQSLSVAAAAAFPVATLTAWYALAKVAQLRRGERVLIHAATGGVGLAAVQWAQHVGAEVFATAGTAQKRALLTELGVRHVSDSRSDRFVADVLAWTAGEGVDVVLNCLSGTLLDKSLGLLRAYGRFVEIGKRDYYENGTLGLRPFLRSLSFSLVDLRGMMRERPEYVAELLKELLQLYEAGVIQAPQPEVFPISAAADAFRKMAQAQHIGKLVLRFDVPDVRIKVPGASGTPIRGDGSYLVTGGLGGLGLSVAGFLAARGAGHLVLLGRTGVTSEQQRTALAALRAQGTTVTVAAVDVADRAALAGVLAALPVERPLRGVVHAAGVLADGLVLQQTAAQFRAVMAPKVQGAWNLHLLTLPLPLDFFVLYSSAAGLLGSAGQSNYAAANTFLDALAHLRRAQGLSAVSIDWGAFSEVGLAAARDDRGKRLEGHGLGSLTPAEGLVALGRVLAGNFTQLAIVRLDVRQYQQSHPAAAASSVLSRLRAQQGTAGPAVVDRSVLERLAAAAPHERPALLEIFLGQQIQKVLRIPPEKLDRDAPLHSLGMDSLMGLELRNRIEAALGKRLPAAILWTYPTVAKLSRHLADPDPLLDADTQRAAQVSPDAPAPDIATADEERLLAILDAELDFADSEKK